jgi:hypothetical protein
VKSSKMLDCAGVVLVNDVFRDDAVLF